jgi:predicted enzyme related to lactoylglutathione lyase
MTTKRVTGIGGIFFKAQDRDRLLAWYRDHLGLDLQDWGGWLFNWRDAADPGRPGHTVWSVFGRDSTYMEPGKASFMINYRVDDLDAVLAALRAEGVDVDPKVEESEFGRFGWAIDPEGNKLELWEPPKTAGS